MTLEEEEAALGSEGSGTEVERGGEVTSTAVTVGVGVGAVPDAERDLGSLTLISMMCSPGGILGSISCLIRSKLFLIDSRLLTTTGSGTGGGTTTAFGSLTLTSMMCSPGATLGSISSLIIRRLFLIDSLFFGTTGSGAGSGFFLSKLFLMDSRGFDTWGSAGHDAVASGVGKGVASFGTSATIMLQ